MILHLYEVKQGNICAHKNLFSSPSGPLDIYIIIKPEEQILLDVNQPFLFWTNDVI